MTVHTTAVPIVKGLPVLGSATRLLRDPLRFICSLRAHGGMVAIRIGALTLFVVVDPRLVRQMLVDKAHAFDKGRQFKKLRLWWGDGLTTSEGTCHLRQRRLIQPAFRGSDNNGTKSGSKRCYRWSQGCARGEVLTSSPASTSRTRGADQHRCVPIQHYRHFSFRCSPTPAPHQTALVQTADEVTELRFRDIKIPVKHHDPLVMIAAYRQLAERCDYPLHLGVTEAGPHFQGTIKSAVAFGVLLAEGIGDTLRVSLSAPPVEEVKVGHQILESLGLRPRHLEIVSYPSCGRAQVDVYTLTEQVTAAFDGLPRPTPHRRDGLCGQRPRRSPRSGPRRLRRQRQIFIRGKIIKTVPDHQIVHTLLNEALHRDWSHGDGRVKQ
jgi:hypothetical protein